MNTDTFDPGPGWTELDETEVVKPFLRELLTWDADGTFQRRRWVRNKLVSPLPTEPYTVIRVTWNHDSHAVFRELVLENGVWYVFGTDFSYMPERLAKRITGFDVLARPLDGGA